MTTDMHKAPSVVRKALNSPGSATPVARYDLSTSEGGRRYIADFFATELRRHDFAGYINTHLAADFACALAQHLVATGKQQVDGVRALPAEWRARAEELDVGDEIGLTHHLKLKDCADELEAALAARQPGAQVPVAGPYLDEPDAPSNPLWKRLRSIANWLTVLAPDCHMEAAELLLTASARIQRNDAAPPAQGIDLGQLKRYALDDGFDRYRGVETDKGAHLYEHDDGDWVKWDDVDALIDQRDAAPGVVNG